jgi:hypothetical protein
MLAGGWITDACLETLRGFLVAIGQFVDAHPGEIRSAEVFVSVQRPERDLRPALWKRKKVFALHVFVGDGMRIEKIQ